MVAPAVGDLNGDGWCDLMGSSSDSSTVYLGNGDGTFQPRLDIDSRMDASSWLFDVDGDGTLDHLGTSWSNNSAIVVRPGIGDGSFSDGMTYGFGRLMIAGLVVDLNGDSKPDILVLDQQNGLLYVALNEGSTPTNVAPGGREEVGAGQVASLQVTVPVDGPARLRFSLHRSTSRMDLSVFDVRGRRLVSLRHGPHVAGDHVVTWDGRDHAGRRVARSIYVARLSVESGQVSRKFLLLSK
jgi:hypothetical protein